ncbi:MAG: hypothetical protein RSG52_15720 [Terrisporobacter sp.]|uniref:hypothetical protein n=1 Tax=Terrisporobacter sp. TaxID=1965305 RepID=UPI002FCA7DC3
MEKKKEYRLRGTYETENAITRIWIPVNQTEEEKQQVMKDIAQAAYDIALGIYKRDKLMLDN